MTGMRRITVSIPEGMDKEIMEIRKNDRFIRCTYSELVRQILECGMKTLGEASDINERNAREE